MTNEEKERDYYKSGVIKGMPPAFLPKRIVVMTSVRGDGPWSSTRIRPGEYECQSNRYGAVSAVAENGHLLGLKPAEFDVIEWRPNTELDERDLRRRWHNEDTSGLSTTTSETTTRP